MTKLMGIC